MTDQNPYAAPNVIEPKSANPKCGSNKELEGLGGWLILVGFGVVVSPIVIGIETFSAFATLFVHGGWEVLTHPESESYHPLWAPIIIAETAFNIAATIAWLVLAFLFFTKSRWFPRVYIVVVVFSFVFLLADSIVISAILPGHPIFEAEAGREVLRSIVGIVIWVPYMLVSKRVKATFVR